MNLTERDLLEKAKTLFDKRSLSSSLQLLEEVIELNPHNSEAYFYIGNIFHIKGALGKAIKALNKVLELEPNHTDAAVSLSVILNDIGKYDEAQKIFEKANKNVKKEYQGLNDPHINKKFSAKHFELAEMYFSYNRYDEALHEYTKAIDLDETNLELRIKIAKVYAKKGFVTKALEELRRLKSDHPKFMPARIALGLLYYGNKNTLEAQSEWVSALEVDPDNAEIKMYLKLSESATETRI